MMGRIGAKNTKPEFIARSEMHRLGYRFRLHRRDLPGTPDLVLVGLRTAIFVHGCFWHQHSGCPAGRLPGTNVKFWTQKLRRNQRRDEQVVKDLGALGWRVVVIWECELESKDSEWRARLPRRADASTS